MIYLRNVCSFLDMFKLCVEATVMFLFYVACSKKRLSGVNCKAGSERSSHCLPTLPSLRSQEQQMLLFFLIRLPKIESFIKFTVFSSPSSS